ncbi:NUDIX domain-containing protein [Spirulina major CS-329]|jgi:8-oxo-dGTP diphosphatase|uniref:NUDIX hydrolase n=1 Tax=Spirulina TaxID=1154 RepID=UPI00232FCC13|nr:MULTISPECIES: NUDIX domain-containing protein [Spirulina]MDB9493163.1 NUDIX domain-containing protein [Spirulina subsalsa CS-330]MDB9502541.1 NUDIX domain-containing protein [Spirulina major CS-329]
MAYCYDFPRPALTVDCVVFGLDEQNSLKVLLIRRNLPPFKGEWALPGGFVRSDETLEQSARRELGEETGVKDIFLEQLYTFGAVERDPRDRIITVAYYALVNLTEHTINATTDADEAKWFPIDALPSLAFDHLHIFQQALQRLKSKLRYEPIGFELLPQKFPLSQLQHLYETVLGKPLDKRNFRKKILKMGLLTALEEWQTDVAHRAARLYAFNPEQYQELKQQGFNFEL